MNILIADDDFTARAMLSGILEMQGHAVIQARDGIEALQGLQGVSAPSIAILDWLMPGMDGIEVIRLLRAIPRAIPPYLIVLTSKNEKSDSIEGLQAGANDYLTKPFDPGELMSRVEVGIRMIELQTTLVEKLEELRLAMEQIKTLRGIVPICSGCKKIRDDTGFWQQVEVYVRNHTEAEFSHGLCPECLQRLYPEL